MAMSDGAYYERRARQHLAAAGLAADPAVKAVHLDLASRYATLREHAARARPDGPPDRQG